MEEQMFKPLLLAIEQDKSLTQPSVDDFMFMGTRSSLTFDKRESDTLLYGYKHKDSRRYVWLDESGQAYKDPRMARFPMKVTNALAFERCYDMVKAC